MKKLTMILSMLLCAWVCHAQKYTTDELQRYSDEYLDTVSIKKSKFINDYTMIGVQGGMGLSMMYWNPSSTQQMRISPYNVGVTYTRYGKMFGYMPYFGFQAGLAFAQEGYKFKADKESGASPTLEGATEAAMNVIELPVMAHCHIDFWKMKLLINLGTFAGYRLSINRIGEAVSEETAHSFLPTDRRFDYGIKGGAGIGFVFDPVEIHLTATYKQSLSSLYQPDYASKYYYRYAYPMNIVFNVGVHYQITRRVGKTGKMLRREAMAEEAAVVENIEENIEEEIEEDEVERSEDRR